MVTAVVGRETGRRRAFMAPGWVGLVVWALAALMPPSAGAEGAFAIREVAVSPRVFNPNAGDTVRIRFVVSHHAKAMVKIFDPALEVVREVILECSAAPTVNEVVWDGRDAQGMVVPDEAYFFTVEGSSFGGETDAYDPTTFSGGDTVVAEGVACDREQGVVTYSLPTAARVRIRAGIRAGGPLLKNIVHASPRPAGAHAEPWDGKDDSGVFDVLGERDFALSVEASTLCENSVISRGNDAYDYFRYRRDVAPERPKKIDRPPRGREAVSGGMERLVPTPLAPEPRFHIDVPGSQGTTAEGLPVVAGRVPIRIRLDESVRKFISEERYEIVLFVDHHFVTEMEEGHSPFTVPWDSRDTGNGQRRITVNVVTLRGQASSGSVRVFVAN
jgi:hypothetical protein